MGCVGGSHQAALTTRSASIIRRMTVDRGRTAAAVPSITCCSVIRTGGGETFWCTVGLVAEMASRVASTDSCESDIADRLHTIWADMMHRTYGRRRSEARVADYSY